eukprot:COSAG01_NODE_134_length_24525_cov_434.185172_9_plen_84_part_00
MHGDDAELAGTAPRADLVTWLLAAAADGCEAAHLRHALLGSSEGAECDPDSSCDEDAAEGGGGGTVSWRYEETRPSSAGRPPP